MFATAVVVALVALGIAFVALLAVGARVAKASLAWSAAVSVVGTVAAGELAARVFHLRSSEVVAAEVGLVVVAWVVAALRRAWNPVGVWFFATVVFAAGAYLALATRATFTDGLRPAGMVLSVILLLLEIAVLLLSCTFAFETCDVICRTRWDRQFEAADATYRPFVSLHVAAYNEPPDILIETIQSLEAIDYPGFEIVVIDNNTADPAVWEPVRDYCEGRSGVRFVHVAPWPGFKSGALNLALREHIDPRAEIVGVVDADYLVKPNWLAGRPGRPVCRPDRGLRPDPTGLPRVGGRRLSHRLS